MRDQAIGLRSALNMRSARPPLAILAPVQVVRLAQGIDHLFDKERVALRLGLDQRERQRAGPARPGDWRSVVATPCSDSSSRSIRWVIASVSSLGQQLRIVARRPVR